MKTTTKHLHGLGILAMMALPALSPTHSPRAADVTVNLSSKKQVIDGFGASSAWCGTINDNVMNSLYGTLGYSILRVRIEENIGDNYKSGPYTSWAPELANAKKAQAKGAIVFASPWNPPTSIRFNKNASNGKFGIEDSKFPAYRDYLNAYVKYFKDNGAPLHAISIQNEPDYAKDWTYWSPTQVHDFILNYGASINTKLMSAESFSYLKNLFDPTLNDAKALENVSIFGTHIYGTSFNNFSYPLFESKGRSAGKKVWMTEHFLNEDDDMTKTVMPVAREIHECMVTGSMNAYVYWWITWANGLANSNGTIFKRAYVIGQWAKHVRPGYSRVDATATPATNVYVSAYTGDSKVVVVAVNTGTSAVSQRFVMLGSSPTTMSTFQTSSSQNMAAGSAIAVSGGAFTANLPAQSITTFVGTGPVGTRPFRRVRALEGFRATGDRSQIAVAPNADAKQYLVTVRTFDGRQIAVRSGNTSGISIPVAGKGTYLVAVKSEGHTQETVVPVF